MSHRIPDSVTSEDFLEALQPLLDLLGVTAAEVSGNGFIINESRIHFTVAARGEGDDHEFPTGLNRVAGVAEAPQEFLTLVWPVTVEVK
jgi:hypothetical protein